MTSKNIPWLTQLYMYAESSTFVYAAMCLLSWNRKWMVYLLKCGSSSQKNIFSYMIFTFILSSCCHSATLICGKILQTAPHGRHHMNDIWMFATVTYSEKEKKKNIASVWYSENSIWCWEANIHYSRVHKKSQLAAILQDQCLHVGWSVRINRTK